MAGAVFGDLCHISWQAQLSSCTMLPHLTRRKTKEGRMPGWAAGNGHCLRFSMFRWVVPVVCDAKLSMTWGMRASQMALLFRQKTGNFNKQRLHSGANRVQPAESTTVRKPAIQDVVALNSVLAVATWAIALTLLCLGWCGRAVASGVFGHLVPRKNSGSS